MLLVLPRVPIDGHLQRVVALEIAIAGAAIRARPVEPFEDVVDAGLNIDNPLFDLAAKPLTRGLKFGTIHRSLLLCP
jgi:hypothetical protein